MTSHDATTHPHTQQEQPRPRGQAYKTVLYRLQKDSLRFTACSVLTTRQLWLFEREGVTLSAISRTAPHIYSSRPSAHADELSVQWLGAYWPSRVSWKCAVNPKRSLGVYWFSDVSWKRTVNYRCSLATYWLSDEMETYRQFKTFAGRVLTDMAARKAPSIPNVRWARTLKFRKVRLLRTDPQTSAGNVPTISYVQSTTYLTTLTVTPDTQRRTFERRCIINWKWRGSGYGLIYGTIPSDIFLERMRNHKTSVVCVPCPDSNLSLLNTSRIVTAWPPSSAQVPGSIFMLRLWLSRSRHRVVWQGCPSFPCLMELKMEVVRSSETFILTDIHLQSGNTYSP
jgi:hypothetical protein